MHVAMPQQNKGHINTVIWPYCLRILSAIVLLTAIIAISFFVTDVSDASDGDKFDDGSWVHDEQGYHYVYYIEYEVISESEKKVKITGCNDLNIKGEYTIKDTITHNEVTYDIVSIGEGAFSGCNYLTDLIIGNNVKDVGNSAFNVCTSLRTVDLGPAVSIGYQSFNGCTSLVSVTMSNYLTTIDSEAFYGCHSLRTIRLGSGVSSIGSLAFNDCFHLVEICNDSSLPLVKGDDTYGRIAKNAVNIYETGSGNSILESKILGGSCTAIYYSDDDAGTSLVAVDDPTSSITLPDSLSGKSYTIGKYAFINTSGINSVVLGTDTLGICDYAFSSCTDLTSIKLNDDLTFIGQNAFSSCPNLISITIPDSVTVFGSYVFTNCKSLKDVSLGSGITSVPNYTFSGCSSIESFVYGDNITEFCNGAFENCTSLSHITIKNNVVTIMNDTFAGCTKLIGSLSDVRVSVVATSVPYIGSNSFPSGTYIMVPSDKLSDYKTGWPQYSATIVADSFDVVFMNGSQVYHSYRANYGDTVTLPSTQPTKESTENYDYKFKSWDGYTEGIKVTSDLKFDALYDEIPREVPSPSPNNGSDNSVLIIVIIVIVAVLIIAGIIIFLIKKKHHG